MSYWDVNDYLAEEELISLKFRREALGLHFLDTTKDFTDNVPQEEPIDVALWKVVTINNYSGPEDVLEVKIPKFFEKGNVFESIRVRSGQSKLESANLKEQSQYFYQMQTLLGEILTKTVEAIEPADLSHVYAKRACSIIAIALKSYSSKEAELNKPGYTRSELELYTKAFKKTVENNDWKLSRNGAKPR